MDEKQGRWKASKKAEVVLRLLRGESIDAVSRECEVTVEALNRWRENFIAAGIAGLKGRTLDQVRIAHAGSVFVATSSPLSISRGV